ncbi:hypothetical protein [Microbacterium sp. LWS13-1.2]|uniref:Uncharacterized protein n=1 Tax=Microbacterium sp. LWS13-1.2 TaxID=3135264 RepID=A0AAU6SGV5_9MICO
MRAPSSERRAGHTGPAARIAALAPLDVSGAVGAGVHPLRAALDAVREHPEVSSATSEASSVDRARLLQERAAVVFRTAREHADAPYFTDVGACVHVEAGEPYAARRGDSEPAPF